MNPQTAMRQTFASPRQSLAMVETMRQSVSNLDNLSNVPHVGIHDANEDSLSELSIGTSSDEEVSIGDSSDDEISIGDSSDEDSSDEELSIGDSSDEELEAENEESKSGEAEANQKVVKPRKPKTKKVRRPVRRVKSADVAHPAALKRASTSDDSCPHCHCHKTKSRGVRRTKSLVGQGDDLPVHSSSHRVTKRRSHRRTTKSVSTAPIARGQRGSSHKRVSKGTTRKRLSRSLSPARVSHHSGLSSTHRRRTRRTNTGAEATTVSRHSRRKRRSYRSRANDQIARALDEPSEPPKEEDAGSDTESGEEFAEEVNEKSTSKLNPGSIFSQVTKATSKLTKQAVKVTEKVVSAVIETTEKSYETIVGDSTGFSLPAQAQAA
ncbi:expressed unknown protein [Seminavis robusta]|uniref:Uncharacterized protein n=1 Tax=Seminavis robusta TaxID=568900 RepID=A0A9N8DNA1_9STRA|nr:expressed unknown protein [Seminavis robusta]|eukprot:Sro242_g096600.1 n/a (380) ;mRNA; r:31840-32979